MIEPLKKRPIHKIYTVCVSINSCSGSIEYSQISLLSSEKHVYSLVSRPFPPPVFDCFQYENTAGRISYGLEAIKYWWWERMSCVVIGTWFKQ